MKGLRLHLHLLLSFSQLELALPSKPAIGLQNKLCSSCRLRHRWRKFFVTPTDQECMRESYGGIEHGMAVKYLPFDGCRTQQPSWTLSTYPVEMTPNKFLFLLPATNCKWLSLFNWGGRRQAGNTTNPPNVEATAVQQRCCHYTNEYSKRDFLRHTIFCCPSLLATRDYIPWVNETPEIVTSTPRWTQYYEKEERTAEKDTMAWHYIIPFLFMGICFMAFPIYRKLKHKKGDVIMRSNEIQANGPPSVRTLGPQEPVDRETEESHLSSEVLHNVPCFSTSSQQRSSRDPNLDGLVSYEEALAFSTVRQRHSADDDLPPPSYVEATSVMP